MSASSVSVWPASAGLSWPRRSAVDPDTATPIVSMAGVLLGSGGGVDHDALAGPGRPDEDRAALGAGDDLSAWCCSALRGAPIRSATSRAASVAGARRRRPGRRRWASWVNAAFDRLLAGRAPRASSSARPPAGARGARRSSPARTASASSGASSPADCSSSDRAQLAAARTSRARSVRRSSTRSASARSGRGARPRRAAARLVRSEVEARGGLVPAR